MNCIIIEDNKVQEQLLASHIEDIGELELLGSYSECKSAIKKLTNSDVDILFLDVEIPNMNGLEFLEKCNLKENTYVILTTANPKYAIEAFDSGVTDFLLKPISYTRFSKAISKVKNQIKMNNSKKDFMFIKSRGSYVKLLYKDILWIQSSSEYVIIYTSSKKYMVYSSMAAILEKLPSTFIRVHRSNIVSVDKIDKLDGNILEVSGQSVKISKMYKESLMTKLGL